MNHINACLMSGGHLLLVQDRNVILDVNSVRGRLTRYAQSPCEVYEMTATSNRDEMYLFLIQAPSEELVASDRDDDDDDESFDDQSTSTVRGPTTLNRKRNNSLLYRTDSLLSESSTQTTVVIQRSSSLKRLGSSHLSIQMHKQQKIDHSKLKGSVTSPTRGTSSTGTTARDIVLIHNLHLAPMRVQAALMEVLDHRQAVFNDRTYCMKDTFVCVATIESGCEKDVIQPLLNRFLMSLELHDKTIPAPNKLQNLKLNTIQTQRKLNEMHMNTLIEQYIRDIIVTCRHDRNFSVSPLPEATSALQIASKAFALLLGESFVTPNTVTMVAPFVLSHRVHLKKNKKYPKATAELYLTNLLKLRLQKP